MPMTTALKLCPHAICIPGRMKRYSEMSHRVMNISFTDDSMYLPLPEAEVTNAPILREPAVEYDFD